MANTYSPLTGSRLTRLRSSVGAAQSSIPYWKNWTGKRCLLLHALVVALAFGAYLFSSPATFLLLSGILVGPVFFFFVWVEGKRTFLKVTPVSMYFVWQGLALGPAAVYAAILILAGTPTYVGMHMALPAYLAKGYVIGLIGTLFLHAGLQWARPVALDQDVVREASAQQVRVMLPLLLILFFLGCTVLTFGAYLSFLGVVLGFFEFSGHAALLSFSLIPSPKLGLPEFMRVTILVAGTAVLAAASTQTNSKLYLMLSFLGLLFYMMQNATLRKHVPIAVSILLFIYLSVVAPMVSGARNIRYRDRMSYSQALWEAFKLYSPLYTGRFDTDFYEQQVDTLLRRQFEASSIAVIAEEVDLNGYLNGETFYGMHYAFIPRLLWPDKPMVVKGAWFTSFLGNSARETDSTSSTGMEAAGELYWNFGYAGVVLGMFILGAMFGGIWRMAGDNPIMRPLHMTLYLLNALTMMNLPEAASRMASCIAIFIFFGIVFSLVRPRRQSSMMVFHRVESPSS